MKTRLLLLTVGACIVGELASAQLRIVTIDAGGRLTWTNSARVGVYSVERSESPAGQWLTLDGPSGLDALWTLTNRVSVQLPVTNQSGFYRVRWTPPEALGAWDYQYYDTNGTLTATGTVNFASRSLLGTNPVAYGYSGIRNIQAVTTNAYKYPDLLGTGEVTGTLIRDWGQFDISWPHCADCGLGSSGMIWPTTHTGSWYQVSIVGGFPGGVFRATKRPAAPGP